jgi:hypothetical protein
MVKFRNEVLLQRHAAAAILWVKADMRLFYVLETFDHAKPCQGQTYALLPFSYEFQVDLQILCHLAHFR